MREDEQEREKAVAFIQAQMVGQERLIRENLVVEPVVMRADVAHIHGGGDQARKRLWREVVFPADGALVALPHEVKQRAEHAEGEQFDGRPNRELAAVFDFVVAHERERALPLDLVFEFADQAFVDGSAVGQNLGAEILRIHIAQRAVGDGQLIGDFGAELHLEKLQHREQQVAQVHVKPV